MCEWRWKTASRNAWQKTGTKPRSRVIIVAVSTGESIIIVEEEKIRLRQYLLGQLNEADEQQVELRLLADRAFGEELDILVDEISLRYAADGFEGDEKEKVERYFLRAPQRQDKVKFMYELLHHSKKRNLFERLRAFWKTSPLTFRFSVTMAVLVIAVGVTLLALSNRTLTYAVTNLQITYAERGQQAEPNEIRSVKFPPHTSQLKIQLILPPLPAQSSTYRAEIIPSSVSRPVTVVSQDSQSVTVQVPTTDLKPDYYAIRLFAIYPDGREERIRGSYEFRVEKPD